MALDRESLVLLGFIPKRPWSFPGGSEDDEAVILHIATRAEDGGGQYEVRVPMIVAADGTLTVGKVKVTPV